MTKYTIRSWNGANPSQIEGLDEARRQAEVRAKAEGSLVRLAQSAPDAGMDFIQCQEVDAEGRWSKWFDDPLPGSRSEIDAIEADAE